MPIELVGAESVADLIEARTVGRARLIVGIIGAPGAGKSTLAAELVRILNDRGTATAMVPMDGFHLSQAELVRLGRRDRMGAPDTFDVDGYIATLRAVRAATADVLVPDFDRGREEPVPGAIMIPFGARIVITEGNWLLLPEEGWGAVADHLDLSIAVLVDDTVRVPRLIARHVAHGKTVEAASAWVERSDEANAARILPTLAGADVAVKVA